MITDIENTITSDHIIANHYIFEKNYWVFETKKLYNNEYEFKRELFRLYSILSVRKIIEEKIITDKNKTYKQWIIKYGDFESNEIDKFRISFIPYKIHKIDNKSFLMSSFFSNTVEIFKKNNYSDKSFELKDTSYVDKICKIPMYFDEIMFEKIYSKIGDDIYGIEKKVKHQINEMRKNIEEVEVLMSLNKEQYLNNVNEKISRDLKIFKNNSTSLPFWIFIRNWIINRYPFSIINNSIIIKIFEQCENEINVLIKWEINDKELNKILENKQNEILKIIEEDIRSGDEVNDRIDNEVYDEGTFIENNKKKLITYYKNLKLIDEEGYFYGKEMIEIRNLKNKRIEMNKVLTKLYSINNLKLLNSIKNQIKGKAIYFPFQFDFRGRMYLNTTIGITNYKLSRYFFHYGEYTEKEIKNVNNINIENFHIPLDKIYSILKKFAINNTENYARQCIFWCLIAIGKEFIKKDKISISANHIFHVGFEKLTKENLEENLEEWVIIEHYKNIIVSLKDNKIKKRFIHKDATASFIQNTIRILGPKNTTSLEYSNLISRDKWYDTYTLALQYWKDKLKIENGFININEKQINIEKLNYFVRRTIKKPIMVDAYEATYLTQWEYFAEEVKNQFEIRLEHRGEEEVLFKNFINFLDKFWVEYFLSKNSDIIIKDAENLLKSQKEIILYLNDSKSNMTYYNLKTKTMDISFIENNIKFRKTKIYNKVDKSSINIRKTTTAIKPNWVHSYDAYLIRQINDKLPNFILSIHDCCLIDCLNVTNFIIIANKCFKELDSNSIADNKDLFKQINGLFIFI